MSKNLALLGGAFVSLYLCSASAEAKLVRYEVNGQRYSYSTNNRQQTREARQRIEAAVAAEAAKTRAAAEATANPLVRIFGSPAQREAAEAQSRVRQVVTAEGEPDVASTNSIARPRTERRRSGKRADARRERARAVRQARLERQGRVEAGRSQKEAPPIAATPGVGSGQKAEVPVATPEQAKPVSNVPVIETSPIVSNQAFSPRERATGEAAGSLTDFVNQVRKAPIDHTPPRL